MRKLTGIILMATVAYAGHIGINHFFTDNFEEKAAFSNLRTKLQKTLVMIDVPASTEVKNIQTIKKKSSATRAVTTTSKSTLINTMKSTYDSLAEVSHIFRHEVAEMISIVEISAPVKTLSPKLTYAKNWSNYIKNNVQKFNMSQDNKNRISTMVVDMQSYISGLTATNVTKAVVKPVVNSVPAVQKPIIVSKAKPTVKTITPVTTSKPFVSANKNEVDTIITKSITESLQALKKWENSRKEASTVVESFSTIWLVVVALFAVIALWMSKTKSVEKLIVTEEETEPELEFIEDEVVAIEATDINEEVMMATTNDEVTVETAVAEPLETALVEDVEANYFFDEISNSLSTLCQAKGIILDTDNLEGCSEIVKKYQLAEVEQEMEDFTKTIIRSLGKEGTKTVKLKFNEKSTKLKMIATVTSENPLDINMTRIASGFRDLEEKLTSRRGVFNIEQSVSGNDIDFVMQLTMTDGKSEINNVEQVEIVPPTV